MTEQKKGTSTAVYMLAAALLALLGVFVANIFLVLLPLPLVIICVSGGRARAFIFIALAAGLGILSGLPFALTLAACLLLSTYVPAYIVQKRLSFYMSVLISCVVVAVCVLLVALAYYLATGLSPSEGVLRGVQSAYEQNAEALAQAMSLLNGVQMTGEQVVQWLMSSIRPVMQPALLMLGSGAVALLGLLYYVVPHNALKKRGAQVGRVPPFRLYALPRYFGVASALIAIACLIGQSMGSAAFQLAWAVVLAFFFVAYYIQGISFLEWWLSGKIKQGALRVLIYILLTVVLFGILIVLVGIFEQAVKLRKRKVV